MNLFFTTKEAGVGTGIGSCCCFGIVKEHGGNIHVESGTGQGAVFTVYLPAVAERNIDTERVVDDINGGNEHILLVDDEEMICELLNKNA